MPQHEVRKRKVFAVIYVDEEGTTRSIWYPIRRKAEEACLRLKRDCKVEEVQV